MAPSCYVGWWIEVEAQIETERRDSGKQLDWEREPALSISGGETEKQFTPNAWRAGQGADGIRALFEPSNKLCELIAERTGVGIGVAVNPEIRLVERIARVATNVLTEASDDVGFKANLGRHGRDVQAFSEEAETHLVPLLVVT